MSQPCSPSQQAFLVGGDRGVLEHSDRSSCCGCSPSAASSSISTTASSLNASLGGRSLGDDASFFFAATGGGGGVRDSSSGGAGAGEGQIMEMYREMENLERALLEERRRRAALEEERAAQEEAYRRDIATLEAMLSRACVERDRLELERSVLAGIAGKQHLPTPPSGSRDADCHPPSPPSSEEPEREQPVDSHRSFVATPFGLEVVGEGDCENDDEDEDEDALGVTCRAPGGELD